MDTTPESTAESTDEYPLSPNTIGAVACGFDIVVFTLLGHFTFDDPIAGALAGIAVGVGVFLFLPVLMQADDETDFDELAEPDSGNPVQQFHRLAGGIGSSVAGIGLFALLLAEFELLIAVPAAVFAGAVVYLVAGFLLPNATPQ